jgi:ketosteroid isomerase-like protein
MKLFIRSTLFALICSLPGVVVAETVTAARITELTAVDTAFNEMAQTVGIPEAFAHYLHKDALNLNGGYDGVPGAEVVAVYKQRRETLQMKWWPIASEIAASSDLGYTWGRVIEHVNHDDGTVEEIRGKYITIWKKNAEGEWKSLTDMGSLDDKPTPSADE